MSDNTASVLIVGAGPTGLVLAIWLTKLGVPVRIIDKNDQPGQTSRALVVQSRTLEFYHQIGIADEVIASGIKMEYFVLRKDGQQIKTVNLGNIGEGLTPYSFVLSFPQDDHEKLLLAHLKKLGVVVERNTELVSFKQTKKMVTATLKVKGQEEKASFAYLCGCDGARSTTREQLGINFPGGTYNQMFYVADVATPDKVIGGVQIGVGNADFCLAFPVRSSDTVRLIGIVPQEHAQKESIGFSDVQDSVTHNMRLKTTQVNWFSTYHVHHRVVPHFKVNRVFLSGDAAHIHSPVGGQGMNTGIGDAINLSWKLAAVLNGKSPEKILETYEQERLPFAKKLVATTDKLFQIVTSRSLLGSLWRHVMFPHIFPFIFKHKRTSQYFFKFVSQIKIQYRNSPLSMKHHGTVQAGDRLPWVPYGATDNFDSLKTLDWQIHVYGTMDKPLHAALQDLNISLIEFAWSEAARNKGLVEHAAYLIRPDGYISVIDLSSNGEQIKKMLLTIQAP